MSACSPYQLKNIASYSDQRVNLAFDEYDLKSENEKNPAQCPVVLMHGMTSSKDTWKECAQLIADRTYRKVVAFDARNHGDSDWTETLDYDAMVEDVSHFLDSRGIDRALLVGHSMGGWVAMKFALEHPDRVDKLVVEDIGLRVLQGMLKNTAAFMEVAKEAVDRVPTGTTDLGEACHFVKSFLKQAATTESPGSPQDEEEDTYDPPLEMTETGRFVWKGNLPAILDFVKTGGLKITPDKLYNGPVLFVFGSQSPFKVLDEKDFLLSKFPRAEFEPISGKTHQLHGVYRDEFCDKVVHFINKAHN